MFPSNFDTPLLALVVLGLTIVTVLTIWHALQPLVNMIASTLAGV
jgi:hypothetical protein